MQDACHLTLDALNGKATSASLTLDDLARLVRRYLPSDAQPVERSRELVREAARKVSGEEVGLEVFELPILEGVYPARWKTRK